MNIEFEKHILELLKNNPCVVLPGFGGFILKSVPSSIHQTTIYPPSKQIAFNASLVHDDELLTGAVMSNYTLAYQEAKNKVLMFSNQLSYTLRKEQHLSLKQIGAFSVGENNQIVFKPFVSNVIDKNTFGLGQFHIKPITKRVIAKENKETAKAFAQSVKSERKVNARKKSKLPIVGLISSVLLMAGISVLIATNTGIPSAATHQAGFVDMLFPNDTFIKSFDNSVAHYTESNIQPSDQKEDYQSGRLFSIKNEALATGYYIVVGSYASLSNAERMEGAMFSKGQDTYILPSVKGLYRVCMFADSNLLTAKTILNEQKIKDAWLMKNVQAI